MSNDNETMSTTARIKTKLAREAVAIETEVTFDWDGVTTEQLRDVAQKALISKLQAQFRNADRIPAQDHVTVADFIQTKRRGRVFSARKQVDKLTDEQKLELLAQLQASING